MSEDKPVKYYCWDCHMDGLGTVEIVGPVYETNEMNIATIWVCTHHKIKRLERDISVAKTRIKWRREEIEKVKQAMDAD